MRRGTNCGNKKWLPILDLFWCLHRSPGSMSRDGEGGFATNALGDPVAAIPPLFSFSTSLSLACRPFGDLVDSAHTHSTAGDPARWVCRSFSSNASNWFLCWSLFPPPLTQLLVLQNLLELTVFHRKEVLLHFNLYLFGSPTPPLLRASARSVITQQKERKQ